MSLKDAEEARWQSANSLERNGNNSDSEVAAHLGVKTVEATHKVYGKYSKWALFIGLGLAAYIYSLDGTTTSTYLSFATSSFGDHSFIGVIQTAQSIIIAVGKPVVAKIADVGSRGFAYIFVLLFYVVGYIVIASAPNVQTIGGGIIIYAVGYTGLQLLTQIIIADITTLKWRGLVSGLMTLPFIINAFVGSNISTSILTHASWRWGYGMFAILVPAALSPLILTLLWAERKAKKLGIVHASLRSPRAIPDLKEQDQLSFVQRAWKVIQKLDVIGLVLLGTSVVLILLPLALANTAKGQWKNPSMIAMLVVGIVLVPVFAIYDFRFAKYPVVPKRYCLNRGVAIAAMIGFFDFVSFYLTFTYLFSFVLVVKPWTLLNATYFAQTQTVSLTVFGILAGFVMRFTHRYKWLLVAGLAIRTLGVGLMIHSRGANGSDAEIVWTQLLQGIGGGMAACASQVGAQASVPHSDVAMVTAVVLLVTEIGGGIGGAIAASIWTNLMPGKLEKYLPFLTEEQRQQLYGSIVSAAAEPRGSPIREGVIQAYDDVMGVMVIAATIISIVPLILSLFMPNWYLGDQQNAVESVDLSGEHVQEGSEENSSGSK